MHYRLNALAGILLLAFTISCNGPHQNQVTEDDQNQLPEQFVVVLGNIQDAGYPHIGCTKECCVSAREHGRSGMVSCIGLVDRNSGKRYLFDATPDISEQLHLINKWKPDTGKIIDGVFLTHAHIGHYTGLMYFGREALGANNINVHVMPRMDTFLKDNGPWGQLLALGNINPMPFPPKSSLQLGGDLTVEPVLVPHRDEYSETVGYVVQSANKALFFLPDIDKWQTWDQELTEWVDKFDYLLIDGTFYQNGEIKNRDMSEIPHPFISETMEWLNKLSAEQKKKVYFIHFNHTNPVLNPDLPARKEIEAQGFNIADEGLILSLD